MGEFVKNEISSWAAVVGRWTFEDGSATYGGPQDVKTVPFPYGICVSNARLSEGEVNLDVELSEGTSGRVLMGYRSPSERYLTVGLGGYGYAYVLSEFEPSYGWRATAVLGSDQNLKPRKQYEVGVQIAGQRVSLSVNSIRVMQYVLEQPLTTGQVGLFAWGDGQVKFGHARISQVPAKVFVVMQLSEPYKQLYAEVIQPAAREFELDAYHAGEIFGPGVILHDIVQGIIEAKIVVAEITPANPNVFYELGFSHALGKPTILLAERGKELPFDVSAYRCLFYENTIAGKKQVEEGLRKHLRAIMHE